MTRIRWIVAGAWLVGCAALSPAQEVATLDLRLAAPADSPNPGHTAGVELEAGQPGPVVIELYVQARLRGDPAATGLAALEVSMDDDASGVFSPALLTNEEAFDLAPGSFAGLDVQGRSGLFPDYRSLLTAGGAGNGSRYNGLNVGGDWKFTPMSFARTGIQDAVDSFDNIYKVRWVTNDTRARRVTLWVLTNAYGYQTADGPVVNYETAVDTFTIDFNGPSCTCALDEVPGVDTFDLLTFLDSWLAQDPAAEWTGDSPAHVDQSDLLAYLDCWFAARAGRPCP